MKLDLESLERKVQAATPGEWRVAMDDGLDTARVVRTDAEGDLYEVADQLESADAAYIAAASPPVVIALIARNRSLQTFVDAIPDSALESFKIYREQAPELFTDEDGNALYMVEAKRRILEKGAVLP